LKKNIRESRWDDTLWFTCFDKCLQVFLEKNHPKKAIKKGRKRLNSENLNI